MGGAWTDEQYLENREKQGSCQLETGHQTDPSEAFSACLARSGLLLSWKVFIEDCELLGDCGAIKSRWPPGKVGPWPSQVSSRSDACGGLWGRYTGSA